MRRVYIKKNRRWVGMAVFVAILLCGIMWYSALVIKVETRAKRETLESLSNTQKTLLTEQEQLQKELEDYQSGDGISEDEIIRIAREKLGLVFEEEIIITPKE